MSPIAGMSSAAEAQGDQAGQKPPQADQPIAATVNEQPVYLAEVERELAPLRQQNKLSEEAVPLWRAKALELVIDRHLVKDYLRRKERLISDKEVDTSVQQAKSLLADRKVSWEDFLEGQNMTEEAFREHVRWQISWNRYASAAITDQALQEVFQSQPGEFDGRKIRVSHILLRPAGKGDEDELRRLIEKAASLREQIVKDELSFADAAKQHSSGPSRLKGGDLGVIERHGEMVEPFAKAAFALDKGEISPPVVTPFGVHLIQCTEIIGGSESAEASREALRKRASLELFQQIARSERGRAKIEYSGLIPYLDPDTKQLVTK